MRDTRGPAQITRSIRYINATVLLWSNRLKAKPDLLQQIIATFDILWIRINNVLCPVTANDIYFLFFT